MRTFTIYDPTTGAVLCSGMCPDSDAELQAGGGGTVLLDVYADQQTQRIDVIDGIPTVSAIEIPPATLEQLKAAAKATLAARRWEVENGGIVLGGMPIATDDRSKLLVTGAAIQAGGNPAFVTRWKTSAGWAELNAVTILGLFAAVTAHVDDCFAREAELGDDIDAASDAAAVAALSDDITAFWPE